MDLGTRLKIEKRLTFSCGELEKVSIQFFNLSLSDCAPSSPWAAAVNIDMHIKVTTFGYIITGVY